MERIHLKFCKSILKVRKSTCNAAVYTDLRTISIIYCKTCKNIEILI